MVLGDISYRYPHYNTEKGLHVALETILMYQCTVLRLPDLCKIGSRRKIRFMAWCRVQLWELWRVNGQGIRPNNNF